MVRIRYVSNTSEYIIAQSPQTAIAPGVTNTLSGRFRSTGTVLSKLHFGVVCYRGDGTQIKSHHNFRMPESLTILKVLTDENNRTVLVLSGPIPSTWFDNASIGYYRAIGVYLEGNTTHTPDFVHYFHELDNAITSGAYQIQAPDRLVLNKPLSDEQLSLVQQHVNRAVVMNHYASSTFHYGAACSVSVPREWTTYSTTYEGESFNDVTGKLRYGDRCHPGLCPGKLSAR